MGRYLHQDRRGVLRTTKASNWPESMRLWEAEVIEILARGKRYPPDALNRGEQGTVFVRFNLDRDGDLMSSLIEKSSGSDSLDREALDLVSRVKRFAPVPPDCTRDRISVSAR
jgi:periplasmic protein TonB